MKAQHVTVIDTHALACCQLCGQKAELRPYGSKGEFVCFECGMKDEVAAIRAFRALLEKGHVVLK